VKYIFFLSFRTTFLFFIQALWLPPSVFSRYRYIYMYWVWSYAIFRVEPPFSAFFVHLGVAQHLFRSDIRSDPFSHRFFLRCAQRKRAKTFTAWISTGCFVNFASRSTWKRFYIEFVFKTGACMVLDRENWSLGVVAKRFLLCDFTLLVTISTY